MDKILALISGMYHHFYMQRALLAAEAAGQQLGRKPVDVPQQVIASAFKLDVPLYSMQNYFIM